MAARSGSGNETTLFKPAGATIMIAAMWKALWELIWWYEYVEKSKEYFLCCWEIINSGTDLSINSLVQMTVPISLTISDSGSLWLLEGDSISGFSGVLSLLPGEPIYGPVNTITPHVRFLLGVTNWGRSWGLGCVKWQTSGLNIEYEKTILTSYHSKQLSYF